MTPFLNTRIELERLEGSLGEHLNGESLETSRTVLNTLRIRPDRAPRWTARLSPFVVLYPLLQSQAWSDRPTKLTRRANEVHLLLLIHAFIDDRLVDGQTSLSTPETVLSNQALLAAWRVARTASLLPPPVEPFWFDGFERYYRSQLQSYGRETKTTSGEELQAREQVVASRAALGQLAAVAACHAANHEDLAPMLSRAFDALAIGLQWEDDLMDWALDVRADQQNLLLACLDAKSIPRLGIIDERLRAIEKLLIDQGTYEFAVERALHWLAQAEELQRSLGCQLLADSIADRSRTIAKFGLRLEHLISAEGGGSSRRRANAPPEPRGPRL
jgi:hypothetical protein